MNETFTGIRVSFWLGHALTSALWCSSLMTYISVASPRCKRRIYHHGWISHQQTVSQFSALGSLCMPNLHVRHVIAWWWWNVRLFKFGRHFHVSLLLMISSVHLTTRTHLDFSVDADVQIYNWKFDTNKHLWISDAAQVKETWGTGKSGWGFCTWQPRWRRRRWLSTTFTSFFHLSLQIWNCQEYDPPLFCNSFLPSREVWNPS